MRQTAFFLAAVFALILAGCGGGGGGGEVVTPVTTTIPSNLAIDAYVGENLNTSALSAPVVGSGAIRVGIDPNVAPPLGTEYRGLIDFPLRGPGRVPVGATIVSATLAIVVNSFEFASPVLVRVDLIEVTTPFVSNNYDVAPVLILSPSASGFNVVGPGRLLVDVTPLMQEAQTPPALPDLQLRLLLPLTGVRQGLVTIDDLTNQPLLIVKYL